MNRLVFDPTSLRHNMEQIRDWMDGHGAYWTLVTKVLCGEPAAIRMLADIGVRSIGDSRLQNMDVIKSVMPDVETWYLRPPSVSDISRIVELSDVSLNSEIEIIRKLDKEAGRQNRVHRVVIMMELGDLREGILPGSLVSFYKSAFNLPNIEIIGIGANLGCLSGAVPSIDQFMQLILYRELLELKFERTLPVISAGASSVLPLVINKSLPRQINHFRIGEAAFLGTDLVFGGLLEGLRNDVVILEAEVTEIKEKSLTPFGETTNMTPFELEIKDNSMPGQRGYRALIDVGMLDTDVAGLTPCDSDLQIAGASSDITVLNLGDTPGRMKIGDKVRFQLSYSALLRLMSNRYVDKVLKDDVTAPPPDDEDAFGDELLSEISTDSID